MKMIKTNPWVGGTDEEYETQHFGFGSQRFKIAVRQMVEQKISTCVKEMQDYLQDGLELNETDRATLTQSCDKLVGLYCERAGPSLGVIDEEIGKMLSVPPGVLLPDDEVQAEQMTDEEFFKLKEEVSALRKRVERGALMEALLSAEEVEFASVEKACEVAKKDMKLLNLLEKNCEKEDSAIALLTETHKVCENVPFLQESPELDFFAFPQ